MADVSCAFHLCSSQKSHRNHHKEIDETLEEHLSDSGRLQEYAVHLDKRGLSRAVDTIHLFNHGLMNSQSFPTEFWKKIQNYQPPGVSSKRTQTQEQKDWSLPKGCFFARFTGSILIDINEELITGNRIYL